jgi:hypothetical protein
MIVLTIFWKLLKRKPVPRSRTVDLFRDEYVETKEDEAEDEEREARVNEGHRAKRVFWRAYYWFA